MYKENNKICKISIKLITIYYSQRKKYLKEYLSLKNYLGRLKNKKSNFEQLSLKNFQQLNSFINIDSYTVLSKQQLLKIILFINNDISIHKYRINYITSLLSVIAALLSILINMILILSSKRIEFNFIITSFILIIFAFLIFLERYNINMRMFIYEEIKDILQYLIKNKS